MMFHYSYPMDLSRRGNEAAAVKHWNKNVPPGTIVCVFRDNGTAQITTTRGTARLLCDAPMVWLNGIGNYHIGCVRPVSIANVSVLDSTKHANQDGES